MADETDSKVRVFVVDDERVIASTIAIILNQNGYDARPFFSGEAALEAFPLEAPHVLISDLVMTGMSGVDLAVHVRTRNAECKILLFSGHIDATVLLEAAERQGFRFAVHTKPISPERLLSMLGSLRENKQESVDQGSL